MYVIMQIVLAAVSIRVNNISICAFSIRIYNSSTEQWKHNVASVMSLFWIDQSQGKRRVTFNPDHFWSDAKVFIFPGVYTVPVQFRISAGTKLFLFPSSNKTVPDSSYRVVPDHFI